MTTASKGLGLLLATMISVVAVGCDNQTSAAYENSGNSSVNTKGNAKGTVEDLAGVWVRKGDAYEGLIIEFARNQFGGYQGELRYVPTAAAANFQYGDVKVKGISMTSEGKFQCRSMRSGPNFIFREVTYEDANLRLSGDTLKFKSVGLHDQELGSKQTWHRLQESENEYGWYWIGKSRNYLLNGDNANAIVAARKAVQCNDNNAEILNDYAWVLSISEGTTEEQRKLALVIAKKACKLTSYGHANIVDTLAAAYATNGNFSQAIKYQKIVVNDTEYVSGSGSRLASYKDHKPWRKNQ